MSRLEESERRRSYSKCPVGRNEILDGESPFFISHDLPLSLSAFNSPLAPRVRPHEVRGPARIGIQKARGGTSAPEKRRDRTIAQQHSSEEKDEKDVAEAIGENGSDAEVEKGGLACCRRCCCSYCPRHAESPHRQARSPLDAAS